MPVLENTQRLLAAIQGFEKETVEIAERGNLSTEALLVSEDIDVRLRLEVYRGLLTSALYVAEKRRPVEDSFWTAILSGGEGVSTGMGTIW